MPNYDVKCGKCSKEFVAFTHIEDRSEIRCDCGGSTRIMIRTQKHIGIHVWVPYLEENITHQPVMVNSKQHLKDLCKKHDVVAHRLD